MSKTIFGIFLKSSYSGHAQSYMIGVADGCNVGKLCKETKKRFPELLVFSEQIELNSLSNRAIRYVPKPNRLSCDDGLYCP